MKSITLSTLILCLLFLTKASAQSDSIEIKTDFLGGVRFFQNGHRVIGFNMRKILASNPAALKEFKRGRMNLGFSYAFILDIQERV